MNDIELHGLDRAALDPTSRSEIEVNVRFVSPDYFKTLGIPLLAGSSIEPADRNRADRSYRPGLRRSYGRGKVRLERYSAPDLRSAGSRRSAS